MLGSNHYGQIFFRVVSANSTPQGTRDSDYGSLGLVNLNTIPATAPPAKSARKWIQISENCTSCMMPMPKPTAGLKAPPEIGPTAKAPVITVMPMASPKKELLA